MINESRNPPRFSESLDQQLHLNLKQILNRLGGDWELFQELIQIFTEDAPEIVNEIKRATESKNATQLEIASHGLKGLASNFSKNEVETLAARLEQSAKTNQWDGVRESVDKLDSAVDLVVDELRSLREP